MLNGMFKSSYSKSSLSYHHTRQKHCLTADLKLYASTNLTEFFTSQTASPHLHVSAAAQQKAQMYAQRPDVGAGLAADPEHGQVAGLVVAVELDVVDGAHAQLPLHRRDERRALEQRSCRTVPSLQLSTAHETCNQPRHMSPAPAQSHVGERVRFQGASKLEPFSERPAIGGRGPRVLRAGDTCERLQGACHCGLPPLHGAVQAGDAYVLLPRTLLALHQPRRPLYAHDQIACAASALHTRYQAHPTESSVRLKDIAGYHGGRH